MLGLLDPAAVVRHRWAETVEGLKVRISSLGWFVTSVAFLRTSMPQKNTAILSGRIETANAAIAEL